MYPIIKKEDSNNFEEFINHWYKFYSYKVYHDSGNNSYNELIHKEEFSPNDIKTLFIWKNGRNLSGVKEKVVENIISKIDLVNELKRNEFDITYFFECFKDIKNGIWKIFLLHIISPQKYPIFDQHVFRAYMYLKESRVQEIDNSGKKKILLY